MLATVGALRCARGPGAGGRDEKQNAELRQSIDWALQEGRIADFAVPLRYDLALRVDPRSPRFSGTAVISMTIKRPTKFVVLHGQDLSVRSVTARLGARSLVGHAARRPFGVLHPELLVIFFDEELPVGPAQMTLQYEGLFGGDKPDSRRIQEGEDARGFIRIEEGGRWFAFTNFEPNGARRVFPCFDEPALRAPFDVTVTAPEGMLVLGNMPEASRTQTAEGVKYKFQPTPPLSTYLFALAVGELTIDEGPRDPVPIRVVRLPGRDGDSQSARDAASGLLGALERYFAYPCPFPKIDLVAVPRFLRGAMENPGLITFREELLLLKKGEASVYLRRGATRVLAHELAHLWTGDLVTHAWWTDVMLSEGLATFLEARAVDLWRPSFGALLGQLSEIQSTMNERGGSLRGAVDSTPSAESMLFAHNYNKYRRGAAFFSMFERHVGQEAFEHVMRQYVRDYAWKAATFDDFIGLLEKESNQQLGAIAHSFLRDETVGLVSIEQKCERGVMRAATVRHGFFSPLPAPDEHLSPPAATAFCLLAPDTPGKICRAITEPTTVIPLGRDARCPAWIDPNPGLAGYYRYDLDKEQLRLVARDNPTRETKLGVLYATWASLRRGRLEPSALLDFLASFDDEQNPELLEEVAWILYKVERWLVEGDTASAFRAYVARVAARNKKRLGLDAPTALAPWRAGSPDESDDVLRARRSVVTLLGLAGDPLILDAAASAAESWLVDPKVSVDSDLGDLAWIFAGRASNARTAALFERLLERAKNPSTPAERRTALGGLAHFDDVSLLKRALDSFLQPGTNADEIREFLRTATPRPASRHAVFDWIGARWDDIRAKWDRPSLEAIAVTLEDACRDDERDALEKRLLSLHPPVPLLEHLRWGAACSETRKFGAANFAEYLRSGANP